MENPTRQRSDNYGAVQHAYNLLFMTIRRTYGTMPQQAVWTECDRSVAVIHAVLTDHLHWHILEHARPSRWDLGQLLSRAWQLFIHNCLQGKWYRHADALIDQIAAATV